MADKVQTTDREKDIAAKIRKACSAISDDVTALDEYKVAATALNGTIGNTKLAVMREVAEMSSLEKWLPGEIKSAVAYASTTMNNADAKDRTAKSLSVFMSEMNTVAHPKVRDQFPTLLSAVEDAWAAEEQAKATDESAPRPVYKWASRKAHALMNVMRAVKNDGEVFTCAADVVSYATDHNPDFNAERVAKRLESVAKTLHGIFVDFDNEDIGIAQRLVDAITADHLIKSRNLKLAKEREAAREHRNLKPGGDAKPRNVTPITPVVTPVATQKPEPEAVDTNEHTMAEGAYDLDTTLNDTLHDREAIVNNEIQKLLAA